MTEQAPSVLRAAPRRVALGPEPIGTRRRLDPPKRAMDILIGGVLSLLTIPLVLVLAVVSAVCLRAWPFFCQDRPGFGDSTFRIVKIRTLGRQTPHYALKHDLSLATVSRPCAWMRRTHLDELPQLWLVVTGQMSLVGPRPRQCASVEEIDAGFDAVRRSMRPGCTGLWQISDATLGIFSENPEYDEAYVDAWTMRMDLWVIARTVGVMLGVARPSTLASVPSWVLPPVLTLQARTRSLLAPVAADVGGEPARRGGR